jgi:CHAT domain-containing protein
VVDQALVAVVIGAAEQARLVRLGPVTPVTMCADSALFAVRRGLRGDRFAARARTDAQGCLAELRRLVIEPLGIPDDAPLILIPAPPLHRVPWAPLHSGPVTLAPSVTLWARSVERAHATHPMAHAVALIAGPGLPGAVAEVAALAEIYPQSVQLLPPDSTVEAAVALVAGAGLAHLACHGRLRTDNPLFSALEFSDGALTVYELLTRGVAPRRTVLAACEAAVDGSYQGNEVLGFVSALMARGTTAVVASVVPLPDGATITLMRHLHEHLHTGATMATALHQARAEALAVSTDPGIFAAWCGLTAYGAG